MKTMKLFTLLAILQAVYFMQISQTMAAGDHAGPGGKPGIHFRIDNYDLDLNITPPFFSPGTLPEILVKLNHIDTHAPPLEAELYIKIDKKKMAGMEGTAMSNSGMNIPMDETGAAGGKEPGLDFGMIAEESEEFDLSAFEKLEPRQMTGTYGVRYPLPEAGQYDVILTVKSLGGKFFAEPVVYGTTIGYQAESKARRYRMYFVLGFIVLTSLVFIPLLRSRRLLGLQPGEPLNLLDIQGVKKFFKSKWFQPLFQIPTFLVFLVLIFIGFTDIQAGDKNLTTMLIWTIWWAGIIFTFVLLGRVWCMMCPFGAAQDIIGRRVSLNHNFPRPLRNIWLSTILFLALTWWDSYSGIVNKPALTAWLFIGFFAVSIVSALIYKGRAFCRYICPIGGLIGLYSMFSPLELRNKCMEVCRKDKIKGCIRGSASGHACPMFETPMTLDRNNYCNLCSECIKSCPEDNIVLRFRGFARDLWVTSKKYMDEAYLAMVLVGLTTLVTAEMIAPWHVWQDALIKLFPTGALGLTGHSAQETFIFTVLFTAGALVLPSLLLLLTSFAVHKSVGNGGVSIKKIFVNFSYMFIPVGISMHLAHNLSHLLTEGQLTIPAIQRAANKYLALNQGEPNWNLAPFMGFEAVFWLQMAVLVTFNIVSLYAGYRIAVNTFQEKALRAFIPMMILVLVFTLVNTFILGQPMSLRHTH